MDDSGVLAVVKSNNTVTDIRNYIESLDIPRLGPITIIYSKGRATSNSVALMSVSLYEELTNKNELCQGEFGHTHISITGLEPYLISESHIPSGIQTNDIYLKFEYLTYDKLNDIPDINQEDLSLYIKSIIDQFISFNIFTESDLPKGSKRDNFYTLDIPLSDRMYTKKPMEYAFLKFREGIQTYICVYIRSILNGHSAKIDDVYVKISAFWCSKQNKFDRDIYHDDVRIKYKHNDTR